MVDHSPGSTFGAKAEVYSKFAETQNRIAKHLSKFVLQTFNQISGNWLDIGCGPAILSKYLFNTQPSLTPILLDISLNTLKITENKSLKVCADMDSLPFLPHSLNGITASSSLQWSQSMELVFQTIQQTLVPKGVLAIALFTENSLLQLCATQREFSIKQPVIFPSHQSIESLLKKNNFTIIDYDQKNFVETFASGIEAIRAINRIGAGFHSGPRFSPSQLKRFISFFESQFSDAIENRYSVSFFIAIRD